MAHPYTTRARLDALIRPTRMVRLLDVDQNGVEDSGVFTDIIERAANQVDSDLARYYVVPFAAITDSPATPGVVADLCDYAAAVLLFELGGSPAAEDAKNFLRRYEALLARIRSGEASVPGATPVAASDAVVAAVFDYVEPVTSGVDTYSRRRSDYLGS